MKKAFIVELSNKRNIKIDADEVDAVIAGVARGAVVKLRQGVVNPSFFVDIVIDEDRMKAFRQELAAAENHNDFQRKYHNGADLKPIPEMRPLADIFADIKRLN